jgi:hypothetical protein
MYLTEMYLKLSLPVTYSAYPLKKSMPVKKISEKNGKINQIKR